MKRLAVVVTTMLLLPGVAPAADPVLKGREIRVTTNLADQYDPAISGNLVVYADRRGSDVDYSYHYADVYYTDLTTMAEVQVTSGIGDQELTDVSDGRIAYMDSGTNDVKVYSTLDGSTVNLTADIRPVAREPGIGQALVAWEDSRDGNWEIYARDLVSGEIRRLSVWEGSDMRPSVQEGVIVWQGCSPTTCAIYAYDWTSMVTTQITGYASDAQKPDVFNGSVVFESNQGGADFDIFRYDLATGVDRRLQRPGDQTDANISGDFVAFEETGADGFTHVRLWHLPTDNVFAVETGTPSGQFLNDIDGNRVVYTDDRDGQFDIYLYEFSLVPTAAAGTDQSVHLGTPATLDGSGSVDLDRNYPLTYAWRIVSAPPASTAALVNATSTSPTLTPDVSGDYVVELVVTDAMQTASDPDTVTVSTWNTPPVADAGPDRAMHRTYDTVFLDGSGSYDDDGDQITYAWTMTATPPGSAVTLSSADSASPQFWPDVIGDYTFTLVVTDSFGVVSDPDSVTLSFTNVRPVANAGGNQAVPVGTLVILDGSGSSDADGDWISYGWSLVSKPEGSQAMLSWLACGLCHGAVNQGPDIDLDAAHGGVVTFTPDIAGQYVASLVVHDGIAVSDPANVTVTAVSSADDLVGSFPPLLDAINGLPAGAFKNANMRNALTNKLAAVLADIENGAYADALAKLENDVLGKTDGCALTGAPDKNDWITDCAVQGQVYPALLEIIGMLRELL